MARISLDDLDRKLIGLLAEDARISNRKIAAELDVTEGTVRSRIKRLEKDNLIRFTAITAFQGEGRHRLAFIRVQADLSHLPAVCDQLRDEPNIGALLITMSKFNLLVITLFKDLDKLHALAAERILLMEGVHHVETAIAIDTFKYDVRVARILD
jgi:DNA-binding Lrp family transcriptional regulator